MDRAEIRTRARKMLGDTTAAYWTDTELNSTITDACNDLAFRAKCIKDDGYLSTTEDTAEYTLSTYFPKLIAILEVYYNQNGETWTRLDPTSRSVLDWESIAWKDVDSGTPTEYFWDREEDLFGLYIPPDENNAGTNYCQIYFAKKHTPMSADTDIPDIPEYLHLAIIDFVAATGFGQRGWGDRANDSWQKYYQKIQDYIVERRREREDEEIIMRNYRC
jgi:hypothetical protein